MSSSHQRERSGSPSYDNYNGSSAGRAGLGLPPAAATALPATQRTVPQQVTVQQPAQPPPPPQQQQNVAGSHVMMREKQSQSVEQVWLSADVYLVCMTHALTTEKDEICGLLLGQPADNGRHIDVTACLPLPRGTHRQKDRVEITPLQMAMGVEHADALQKSHGMNVRVVGWYHSHPRLMPIPSSVDVRSQEACEQQDATFVGLIFTPFNSASKQNPLTQQLQLLAFKTDRTSSLGFRQLPISVIDLGGRGKSGLGGLSRWALDTLRDLLVVLQSEEDELMSQTKVEDGQTNFLANTTYSYRLMRVMNEIGYPVIAALQSRLESSRGGESAAEGTVEKHLLDATSPNNVQNLLNVSSSGHSNGNSRTPTPTNISQTASSGGTSRSVGGGGSQQHPRQASKTQPLYSQAHFGTNV